MGSIDRVSESQDLSRFFKNKSLFLKPNNYSKRIMLVGEWAGLLYFTGRKLERVHASTP